MSQDEKVVLGKQGIVDVYEVSEITLRNQGGFVAELNLAKWTEKNDGKRYEGDGKNITLGCSQTVHLGVAPFNIPDGTLVVPDVTVKWGDDNRDTIPVKYKKDSANRAIYVISGTTKGNQLSLNKIEPVAMDDDRREALISELDVCIGNEVKSGYVKLSVDLNYDAGGKYLYLCYKEGSKDDQCVTDMKIISGKNAKAPEGYTKIDVDLNKGAGGDYLYLCYKKGSGAPIKAIGVFVTDDAYEYDNYAGYKVINVDLNRKAGGEYVYLCYKK